MSGRDALRLHALRSGSVEDTATDVLGQRRLVAMLQLAAATLAEMAAGWLRVVRPVLKCAIGQYRVTRRGQRHVASGCGDAVSLGGDANDRLSDFTHERAS